MISSIFLSFFLIASASASGSDQPLYQLIQQIETKVAKINIATCQSTPSLTEELMKQCQQASDQIIKKIDTDFPPIAEKVFDDAKQNEGGDYFVLDPQSNKWYLPRNPSVQTANGDYENAMIIAKNLNEKFKAFMKSQQQQGGLKRRGIQGYQWFKGLFSGTAKNNVPDNIYPNSQRPQLDKNQWNPSQNGQTQVSAKEMTYAQI